MNIYVEAIYIQLDNNPANNPNSYFLIKINHIESLTIFNLMETYGKVMGNIACMYEQNCSIKIKPKDMWYKNEDKFIAGLAH